MGLLIFGLVVFLGVHCVSIVAPVWRQERIASMGEGAWKGIYSVVSLVGLVAIIYGYGAARENAGELFQPFQWARGISFVAMPIALVLVIASNFPAGYIKQLTKHPMLWGVILWAVFHLLMNGDSASALLMGAILIWAVVDLVSAYRRPASEPSAMRIWPDVASILIGLGLAYLVVRYFHAMFFGMAIV